MTKKNNDSQNSENKIEKRLDAIISILLDSEISKETQAKKIDYLSKLSFSNPEIAILLNTSLKSLEGQKYRKPKTKKITTSKDLVKSKN